MRIRVYARHTVVDADGCTESKLHRQPERRLSAGALGHHNRVVHAHASAPEMTPGTSKSDANDVHISR
ncbi:hypothetical protein [Gulosibacter hominis]|uniref:hypothetical protein n=1 Tax=Gulosibacter hominis TaxID=2770504 RepID=UPI0019187641|nr:hypothetical protein [Gulosibacter hominis]